MSFRSPLRAALLALPLLVPPGLPAAVPPVPSSPPPPPSPVAAAPLDPAVLRRELLTAINAERARSGAAALAPAPALDKVAQGRAEELARAGGLPSDEEAFRLFSEVQRRIARAGYLAHGWTESVTVSAGGVPEVIGYWKGDASFRDAMGADYKDVGIGFSTLQGVPLYTFLFAWPERDFFGLQTAKLGDLEAVRAAMLAQVNAVRRAAGRSPLALDPRLNAAAQRHAEDMLARGYYAHASPEGSTPMARVRAAGYPSRRVGENIAEGEFSVEEVMDGWMKSAGHRENLLDETFDHLGVGLAVGRFEDRLRLLWVQDFGRLAQEPTVDPLPPSRRP